MPTNSTAKATEIGLSDPTTPTAKVVQAINPTASVTMMARNIRVELSARNSHRHSNPPASKVENAAPSDSVAS